MYENAINRDSDSQSLQRWLLLTDGPKTRTQSRHRTTEAVIHEETATVDPMTVVTAHHSHHAAAECRRIVRAPPR